MNFADLPDRLRRVREEIARARERAGSSHAEVTLVAVTKTHGPEAVRAVLAAGLVDAGENRIQELEVKVEAVGREAVRWHLLGPLQRNKVKRAIPLFDLMHSLDSVRVAEKVSAESAAAGLITRALVQVNTSGEQSKSGFAADGVVDAVGEMAALPGLRAVRGDDDGAVHRRRAGDPGDLSGRPSPVRGAAATGAGLPCGASLDGDEQRLYDRGGGGEHNGSPRHRPSR